MLQSTGSQSRTELSAWTAKHPHGPPRWRWWLGTCCQRRKQRRHGFHPWVRKIPWRWAQQPAPVFLPGKPTDRGAWQATVHWVTESDTTEATQHSIYIHAFRWQWIKIKLKIQFLGHASHIPRAQGHMQVLYWVMQVKHFHHHRKFSWTALLQPLNPGYLAFIYTA